MTTTAATTKSPENEGYMKSTAISRIRAKQIHASQVDITVDHRRQQQQQQQSCSMNNSICIMDTDDDEGSLVDISSLFVSGPNGGATIAVYGPHNNKCENNPTDDGRVTLQPPQHQQRRRAVRIKSHHGPIQVSTNHISKPMDQNPMTEQYYPIVELGGVNGSCEVSIDNTIRPRPVVVDDPTESRNDEWSSCLVHIDSLAPDSVSLVTADIGHIDITVDRKSEADLRLASVSNPECIHAVGALLAEEDDNNHILNILNYLQNSNSSNEIFSDQTNNKERILIDTSAFTRRLEQSISNNTVSYVDGWVENKSSEPDSRFERKNRGPEGIGKIRLDGAHTQALNAFSSSGASKDGIKPDKEVLRPLFTAVGTEEIRVETVSWLGAIARRYGLEESGRELGRTASRKGRSLSDLKQ
jgi:hypothetical protein